MNETTEYRIDVKIRNNLILEKMEKMGIKNVAELARLAKVNQTHLGRLINLKQSPFNTVSSTESEPQWNESVKKVAEALGCIPEDLFPEDVPVLRTNISSVKVRAKTLWGILEQNRASLKALPSDKTIEASELRNALDGMLRTLTEREQIVLYARFFDDKTLEETGIQFGCTRERVRQIEIGALRKLRRSNKSALLLEMGAEDNEILNALHVTCADGEF